MPKSEKVKVNVKDRVDDNTCDLSLSALTEVPVREIASFKRVTVLDLSSNSLITLGKHFSCLTRLVKIDLSKNQIKYLPDDFGLLRNLRHLDLYDNKLEHLPLSFGNLTNLRYLDLKGNPLTPALAKIVGLCLTTKECQDSARNTVTFLARMQAEAVKAKEQVKIEAASNVAEHIGEPSNEDKPTENQKSKKSANKKTKSKAKKGNNAGSNNSNNSQESLKDVHITPAKPSTNKMPKAKKATNGALKKSSASSSTALTSILTFFLLLAINILIIYMIMFKNPEIADKLVEFIPHQYREWILTKTEVFRLCVTDWISEFRTPPEEH